jgi:hypothetical protein
MTREEFKAAACEELNIENDSTVLCTIGEAVDGGDVVKLYREVFDTSDVIGYVVFYRGTLVTAFYA